MKCKYYIFVLNPKSNKIHNSNVSLILGKEWGRKANTICLPFDEKPNEKYLDMDVTVAGWGYTKADEDQCMLLL